MLSLTHTNTKWICILCVVSFMSLGNYVEYDGNDGQMTRYIIRRIYNLRVMAEDYMEKEEENEELTQIYRMSSVSVRLTSKSDGCVLFVCLHRFWDPTGA